MGDSVFVLGAGFSRAVSATMPSLRELSGDLRSQLQLSGTSLPRPALAFPDDLEAWLSVLADDQPWLSEAENHRNRAVFLEISEIIFEVIQTSSIRAAMKPMPAWLARLIHYWDEMSSTVISFNYDLLVEWAYQEVKNAALLAGEEDAPDLRWWRDLYRLPLTLAGERGGELFGPTGEPSFSLLKMHGSVNWFYSGSASYPGDIIYDTGVWHRWSESLMKPIPNEEAWVADKVPLVIPPTNSKNRYYSNEALRVQWRHAQRSLEEADELFILGYSVPSSDNLVRALLGTGFEEGLVVPVNLDATVGGRLDELFAGNPKVYVDRSFVGSEDGMQRFVDFRCGVG